MPRAPSPPVKQLVLLTDHATPSLAEFKNNWTCTTILSYAFMACKETILLFTFTFIVFYSMLFTGGWSGNI